MAGGTIDRLFFPDYVASKVPYFGTGGILTSLTLALMTVPVVVVSTEEALAAVPRAVRERWRAGPPNGRRSSAWFCRPVHRGC